MLIQKHSHDGFTLSDYVKTKIGQEVDVSKRIYCFRCLSINKEV